MYFSETCFLFTSSQIYLIIKETSGTLFVNLFSEKLEVQGRLKRKKKGLLELIQSMII